MRTEGRGTGQFVDSLQNINRVARHPNVDLLEALLEMFLELEKELPAVDRILDIKILVGPRELFGGEYVPLNLNR